MAVDIGETSRVLLLCAADHRCFTFNSPKKQRFTIKPDFIPIPTNAKANRRNGQSDQ